MMARGLGQRSRRSGLPGDAAALEVLSFAVLVVVLVAGRVAVAAVDARSGFPGGADRAPDDVRAGGAGPVDGTVVEEVVAAVVLGGGLVGDREAEGAVLPPV